MHMTQSAEQRLDHGEVADLDPGRRARPGRHRGLRDFSLPKIQRAMDAADAAVTLRAQARGVAGDLASGQAALYRAINLKSQNVETAIVHAAKMRLRSTPSTAARKTVAALNVNGLAIDAGLVTTAAKAVDAYAQAANQAASFVEDDAFNATMFMTDAEQKYAVAERRHRRAARGRGEGCPTRRSKRFSDTLHDGVVDIPLGAALAVAAVDRVVHAVRPADRRGRSWR